MLQYMVVLISIPLLIVRRNRFQRWRRKGEEAMEKEGMKTKEEGGRRGNEFQQWKRKEEECFYQSVHHVPFT